MKIPKVFGNKIILVVVALALILTVVYFLSYKVIDIEYNWFCWFNNEGKTTINHIILLQFQDSENNNQGNPFSITILD